MKSRTIRQLFLDYFIEKGHTYQPSGPIIPKNDQTLLFTNAGMVAFKDIFLGIEKAAFGSATSAQLCVRAGGKHNDLENVGYTLRHHTLFEMLGNFSFGDYSKAQAIEYAWDFLTNVLSLPAEKLMVTVYEEDDEAALIWEQKIGVKKSRIIRCGKEDNFWSMGETGPCGPCSEIFYDHGPAVSGGPPGSADADGDRFVEIWNLVFMQYNRTSDGVLEDLDVACIDTGMGFERVCAVMQGVSDNYDTDIFQGLLHALSDIIGEKDIRLAAMRVIVDHIRAACFIIAHGVTPSNEGRGYVLRHIIRRALRYGFKLGEKKPFFYKMVKPLLVEMGDAYPELVHNRLHIEEVLKQEESHFADTLVQGLKLLDHEIQQLKGTQLDGKVVFKLYDTYGFPADLTADIAKENNLTIDFDEYNKQLDQQRKKSRVGAKFNVDYTQQLHIHGETEFIGYSSLSGQAVITQILYDQKPVNALMDGQDGVIVLDRTPFYAEGGGQVGDKGVLLEGDRCFVVSDTTRMAGNILHHGTITKGSFCIGAKVEAQVDASRQEIACNHSATHLLHAALREILGVHVQQKGSQVSASRLRFDFTHTNGLSEEQIDMVELLVNQQIWQNLPVELKTQSIEDARASGALALFDEKYNADVRVLKMGEFSHEVCGGTHVQATGDIGSFKIIQETAVASGIRRIEAATQQAALNLAQENQHRLKQMVGKLKAKPHALIERVEQLLEQQSQSEAHCAKLKQDLIAIQSRQLLGLGKQIDGVFVLAIEVRNANKESLLFLADHIKSKHPNHAVVLASVTQAQKIILVVSVGQGTTQFFKASELLNQVTEHVGGRGGGRPTLAQGGGDRPEDLKQVLENVVPDWIRQKLSP